MNLYKKPSPKESPQRHLGYAIDALEVIKDLFDTFESAVHADHCEDQHHIHLPFFIIEQLRNVQESVEIARKKLNGV